MNLIAIAAYQDCNDERTAGNTELHRNGHSRNGNRQRTEDNADDDADENCGYVRRIKAADGVTHHVGDAVHGIFRTYHHNAVAHL